MMYCGYLNVLFLKRASRHSKASVDQIEVLADADLTSDGRSITGTLITGLLA